MKTVRTVTLVTILALSAAGCGENAVNPSRGRLALGAAGKGAGQPNASGGDCGDLPTAPDSVRVDLGTPVFSNTTNVTNPLFPIGALERVLLLGNVDGQPLRVETTLLPGTQIIEIDGQKVEALVSQYVAWIDRRIEEVALDWYVQDDDGAAWYLGEDVFNYEEGVIADLNGTWLADRDGPAAMIMPADPQVGDVWRPENICGFVFEEVTAVSTGITVQGPRGPVAGALIVRELHMDGSFEEKTFAPGYGEFSTGSGSNLEAVALAVPTDALPGPVPTEIESLSDGAEEIFELAKTGRWRETAAAAEEMNDAWDAYRATGVPPMLDAQMSDALEALHAAIAARDKAETRQASVDVALASLDFELRHEPREEIDLDLIEIWSRQILVDTRAHDQGAVLGDLATIEWIRDRLAPAVAGHVGAALTALRAAADANDMAGAEEGAARLRDALAGRTPRDS